MTDSEHTDDTQMFTFIEHQLTELRREIAQLRNQENRRLDHIIYRIDALENDVSILDARTEELNKTD